MNVTKKQVRTDPSAICKYCGDEFNVTVAERRYGKVWWSHMYCCSSCYTDAMTEEVSENVVTETVK